MQQTQKGRKQAKWSNWQDINERFKRAWGRFKYSYVNDEENHHYLFTRHHLGSSLAICMSVYNLFQVRQRVIKHAISLVNSNQPSKVRPAIFAVGFIYWLGLLAVWHIPSIGAQSAARTYIAMEDATTTYILDGSQIAERCLSNQRRRKILNRQGIRLNDEVITRRN